AAKGETMASTVTYQYPSSVAGGTTAPAAGWGGNCVTATLAMLDTDTSATFNHGFSLSSAELTALFPQINAYQVATHGRAVVLSCSGLSANPSTTKKASPTGSGGTWVVQAYRPMSWNK